MNVKIETIQYAQSFFKPGEPARLSVQVSGEAGALELVASFRSLFRAVGEIRRPLDLSAGPVNVWLEWQPPAAAPAGYGLELRVLGPGSQVLAEASSAFDVLERWTQNPRYGFLSDYSPSRSDEADTMASLTGYHVNALQFYDWMYHHDQFLVSWDPYTDLFGRVHSIQTVKRLIDAAHQREIAAMPYTAVYGASLEFFKAHPEWDMYKADGTPHVFIENLMGYMDMRPGSGWTQHLLAQFQDILGSTSFDGIHLDQYGGPKIGYDSQGNAFDLAQPMADMINATAELVRRERGNRGAVVFNAVTNWPIEKVAPAREDIVYIEVWEPYTSFTNLRQLILQAQRLGGGKPVVLAAYIDPALQANARLMDAIIFASGGGHIALGEKDGYLADPYFPKYKTLTPELSATLKRYIETAIRYQEVLGPTAQDVTADYQNRLSVQGVETTPSLLFDKVYPIARENGRYTALSLVNLLGLKHGEWAKEVSAPRSLGPTTVEISGVDRPVSQVGFVSPDGAALEPRLLEFSQSGGLLRFTLPSLEYWDLLLIEWKE
jgi:dextranase